MMRHFNLLAFASCALAAIRDVTLSERSRSNITYVEDVNPDGLQPRRVIGVNGTWPPPPIIGFDGDTVRVTAINSLDTGTSLHFHGNYFVGKSMYDGAVGTTQCAIPPGGNLTYEVPFAQGPGTYWYHGHYQGQYVDGLRAPYIIQQANEPQVYKYDEEFTVILGDWYHDQHADLMKHFLSKANPTGAEPVPNSGLIYFAQNDTYLPGFNENASLPFQPGKTYRLRVINASAFSMFFVWIQGHNMTIIEADGTMVEPYQVEDMFSISVAQRYSVLVTALNDTSANYIFHATQNADMYDVVPDDLVLNTTAVVSYNSNNPAPTPDTVESYSDFNDTVLVPVIAQAMEPATWNLSLTAIFDTYGDGTPRAGFNSIVWNPPNTPSLFSMLSMGNLSTEEVIYGPSSYIVATNTNVEIEIINGDTGLHPFHLHGHKFQVVQKNNNVTSDVPEDNPPLVEGQANPIRRDTVTVPAQGSTTIRFVTNNPGAWLLHCHIDWHFSQGLAVAFIEDPIEAQQQLTLPSVMAQQCQVNGYSATGNAAGHNSTTDFSGFAEGPYPEVDTFGWTPRAKGALAGCVITALLGMLTIVWYSFFGTAVTDEEHEEEAREAHERKEAAGGSLVKRGWNALRRDRPESLTPQ